MPNGKPAIMTDKSSNKPSVPQDAPRSFPKLSATDRANLATLVHEAGGRDKAAKRLGISEWSLKRVLSDPKAGVRKSTRDQIRKRIKETVHNVQRRDTEQAIIESGVKKTPPIFARLIREVEACFSPTREQLNRIEKDLKLIKTHLGL